MSTHARDVADATAAEFRTTDVRARRRVPDLLHFVRTCRDTPGGWIVQWPMETAWELWRTDATDAKWAVKVARGTLETCLSAARIEEIR